MKIGGKTDSGYCICMECKLKCDGSLPKRRNCHSYRDTDETPQCKGCMEIWTTNDVYSDSIPIFAYYNWRSFLQL